MTADWRTPPPAAPAQPELLVEWAGRLASMASSGLVGEDHVVEVLTDAAARDPGVLRDAELRSQQDPDMVPAAAALLSRAVTAAQQPLRIRRSDPPSAPGP